MVMVFSPLGIAQEPLGQEIKQNIAILIFFQFKSRDEIEQ